MIKRSCKGNACIGFLKAQIDEIRPELTWNDCFVIGAQACRNFTLDDYREKYQELKLLKRTVPADAKYPTAIQVCIDNAADVEDLETNLKTALELSRLQAGLEFELLLLVALDSLKSQAMCVGRTKTNKDLTGPEMVKRLVEILMLDREQDREVIEEIKSALLKWEV